MPDHDDLPYIVIERRSGAVAPFLWGALVGAAVALLWAPRSGKETQEELYTAAERFRTAFRDRVDEARQSVVGVVDGVRQRVQDQVAEVRDAVESRAEGVRHAVDSGRRAARDARSELEQRVAEAKRNATDAVDIDAPAGAADVDVVITEIIEERPPRTEQG